MGAMKIGRSTWTEQRGWADAMADDGVRQRAQLVLAFGATSLMKNGLMTEVRERHPNAYIFGCSTAGEIAGERVLDDSMVTTAVELERSSFRAADVAIAGAGESFEAGRTLAASIPHEGLVHAFVLSDGLAVNGTELVRGINSVLPPGVAATGGLSGDGARFAETYVCAGGVAAQKRVVLVGFYGERLRVGYGSLGGWDPFGPERRITRSKGNVLFELDGRSALSLYKEYLGHHAADLPASGLLFPLALRQNTEDEAVVRTILAVDEEEQSMTFAGDMPEGGLARLMRANFDRLVDGASGAARTCRSVGPENAQLAVLISCVGRKLLLKQRIEEEVEGVINVLGPTASTTGFYSYGEISPLCPEARCALHNQTMTITSFAEV
jgi:hypothetical protein